MSYYGNTVTETATFTVTHARHMAAKVAADLRRMQRYYGYPSDHNIFEYEAEVVELLKYGYLGTVQYGFRKDGQFIPPTLRYTSNQLANDNTPDDDPGRVPAGCDITGGVFCSYLTHSSTWEKLTPAETEAFEKSLPFKRTVADAPGHKGYYVDDRTYAAGGQSLGRSTLRSF